MVTPTIDVLIISLVIIAFIEVIKAPVKSKLAAKGMLSSKTQQKVFKLIVITISTIIGFIGALIYFFLILKVNPFIDLKILWYTLGIVGTSQLLYIYFETYGRDGLWLLIKNSILKKYNITDINAIPNPLATIASKEKFAAQIAEQLKEMFEGSPVTVEDVKQILDHIQ